MMTGALPVISFKSIQGRQEFRFNNATYENMLFSSFSWFLK